MTSFNQQMELLGHCLRDFPEPEETRFCSSVIGSCFCRKQAEDQTLLIRWESSGTGTVVNRGPSVLGQGVTGAGLKWLAAAAVGLGRGAKDRPHVSPQRATALPDDEDDDDEGGHGMTLPLQAHHAMEKMEEFVYKVWEGRWRVIPYHVLPEWLKDNDYLLHGHRPPMPSFRACFGSIFRIHTETGNIWTHLLGLVLFLCLGTLTMLRPNMYFTAPLQEKVVFGTFFLSAVLCLSFSWLFHTVYCHSEKVSRTFSKLDYSGIALLIMGSFVPWLYYSFYCSPQPRLIYLCIVCVLGIAAIIVAQWDRFSTPRHRPTRAGEASGALVCPAMCRPGTYFNGLPNLQLQSPGPDQV
ncbi:hypothetical protein JZ751_017437 [Albula glossodonta]|uniref:Adiponectin receptor 1 n=1 Tax=Albula glossodonta TaxID=121402 RepID=A0A8T2PMA5_9TELE|nr:hypothetical protein JZ751_017437 [Albula glossodonta]